MRRTGRSEAHVWLAGLMVQLWLVVGLITWVFCSGGQGRRRDALTTALARGAVEEETEKDSGSETGSEERGNLVSSAVSGAQVMSREGAPGLIRLLGQYGIEGPGGDIGGRARDMWALLGLLAEHRSVLLTRTAAQDKLWAGAVQSPDKFANLLKETRGKLCDALGKPGGCGRAVIQFVGSSGYRINPDLFTCDVWQMRDLLGRASTVSGEEKVTVLLEAVALHSGCYLAGVSHSWALNAAESVTREVVQALVQLADLEEKAELEAHYLERATELDGSAEHLFRRRMEAYARLGRTQAIHYCYDELCVEMETRGRRPAADTERLYLRVTGVV